MSVLYCLNIRIFYLPVLPSYPSVLTTTTLFWALCCIENGVTVVTVAGEANGNCNDDVCLG